MANNASAGRFYAFTGDTSAPLPPSTTPPDHPFRRHSSGSDSVSDDGRSAIGHSYHVEQAPQGQGILGGQFGAHDVAGFVQIRADPAFTTLYRDDTPFVPNVPFQPPLPSNFAPAGPDAHFPSAIDNFNSVMPPSMTQTTPYGTPYGHGSGNSSPAGSNGSGGSDGSGHMSGSSLESVSNGIVGYMAPPNDPGFQGHDAFAPQQRVGPLPGFNREYYPAYDEHRRRIGMEYARFGTEPRQGYAYYRPRTHTYPPVGVQGVAPTMGSPEQVQSPNFPSPEMQMIPMGNEHFQYDHDARVDAVIPGQTRIHLSPPNAPRQQDNPNADELPSALFSGDDACFNTSDDEIRRYLGLAPGEEMSLNALPDPPEGQRPGYSIPVLSQLAILGSPNKRLTLQEIYQELEKRFDWFRNNHHDKSWQNSIRHNLSLYKCFRRQSKPITEPGKGSYWVVDYSEGPGTKRPRKRNKRTKAQGSKQPSQDSREDESDPDALDTDDSFPSPSQVGYDISVGSQVYAQSHQVGQGRSRPPASVARSIVRRGNSPYSQNVHGRPSRQGAHPPQAVNRGDLAGMRPSSGTYGGQHAFGLPSIAPQGYGQSAYEQELSIGRGAPGGWGPVQSQSLQFPPPAGFHTMPPILPPPQRPRVPARAHTLPNITQGLQGNYAPAPYNPTPSRQTYAPPRDSSGRFMSRSAVSGQPSEQPAQSFVQGSSRSGKRTSPSSDSSRE